MRNAGQSEYPSSGWTVIRSRVTSRRSSDVESPLRANLLCRGHTGRLQSEPTGATPPTREEQVMRSMLSMLRFWKLSLTGGLCLLCVSLSLVLSEVTSSSSNEPRIESKIVFVAVNRVERFGDRQNYRIDGVVGSSLDDLGRSKVLEEMLSRGVGVMLRHVESNKPQPTTQIVSVDPDVFYPGCVVVFSCTGPSPKN